MTMNKQEYLRQMRTNTAYPIYRGTIGVITVMGYLLAVLNACGAVIFGLSVMSTSTLAGLGVLIVGAVISTLMFLMARFWREASLMLADIGDCLTEADARVYGSR